MIDNKFIQNLKMSLREIELGYDKSQMIKHKATKGSLREFSLLQVLQKYLPNKYSFTSGEIYDFEGNVSNQQDIIIYDAYYLLNIPLSDDLSQIYKDAVYGTIEVKSLLNTKSLNESLTNISSVKMMKKTTSSDLYINPTYTINFNNCEVSQNNVDETLNGIFVYKTDMSIDSILTILGNKSNEIDYCLLPNFIVLLDKKVIIHRLKMRQEDNKVGIKSLGDYDYFGYLQYDDDLLSIFILQMYCDLSIIHTHAEDFIKLRNEIQAQYINKNLPNSQIKTTSINKQKRT